MGQFFFSHVVCHPANAFLSSGVQSVCTTFGRMGSVLLASWLGLPSSMVLWIQRPSQLHVQHHWHRVPCYDGVRGNPSLVLCALSSGSFERASTRQECPSLFAFGICLVCWLHSASFSILSRRGVSRSCWSCTFQVVGMPSIRTSWCLWGFCAGVPNSTAPLRISKESFFDKCEVPAVLVLLCACVCRGCVGLKSRPHPSAIPRCLRVTTASFVHSVGTNKSPIARFHCLQRVQLLFHLFGVLLPSGGA